MPRQPNLKAVRDEELVQISAYTRVEEAVFAAGCVGGIVVLLLLLAVFILGGAAQPFFLGVLLPLVMMFSAHHLLGRFKQPYREELAYRCGRSAFSHYVEEAQAALSQLQADWIVLFTTTGLPHGNHRWLRIELRRGTQPSARAELRVSRSSSEFSRTEADIPHDVIAALLSTLQGLDLNAMTDLPSLVRDGAPSNVAILHREPRDVAIASCNLGSDNEEEVQHPTARVCAELYRITLRLTERDTAV
jgi:hypothetical protein